MHNTENNDETLVLLTLAGNTNAYEILVKKYEKAVIASALAVTRSTYMAEDAAQDAFVIAWMKLNTLSDPNKYSAWVCKIAKNCARKIVMRYKSYLSLDALEDLNLTDGDAGNPSFIYIKDEEQRLLHSTVSRLSKRVREVIELHYFKGLSVMEIAEKLGVSASTVKWQLHDGRKKIRKELGAMNEEWNDTLVKRVMKKVEELKLWYRKNNKNGFEKAYKDTLEEIEELPECTDKFHALADVLMLGWWWIPGEKNDMMLKKIKEYAVLGKNDEAMSYIVGNDIDKLYGDERINYILKELIPSLNEEDFPLTMSTALLYLTFEYNDREMFEKSAKVYNQILDIVPKDNTTYAFTVARSEINKLIIDTFKDKSEKKYSLTGCGYELSFSKNSVMMNGDRWSSSGQFWSYDRNADLFFEGSSLCDKCFFDTSIKLGKKIIGSDDSTLEYVSSSESVETPAGVFTDCCLWVTCYGENTHKTYYKDGVGIVKYEKQCLDTTETRLLKSYTIIGGEGLIPCAKGNRWEYTALCDENYMIHTSTVTVAYADDSKALLTQVIAVEHIKYNENSWTDMMKQIRSEYFDGNNVCDVSYPMKRAKELAVTPIQKLHTEVACSVAKRIMDTHGNFIKDKQATGHWNFFNRRIVKATEEKLTLSEWNFQWSFELKSSSTTSGFIPLLFNDIYQILQSNTGCIWSDEWMQKDRVNTECILWGSHPIKTEIAIKKDISITTAAGCFNNCLRLEITTSGLSDVDGLEYIGGKKTYYFCEGIGIVRTECEYNGINSVYELTEFIGTGKGFMPMGDGFKRKYDAQGLTDGYIANTTYYYIEHNGQIVIFEDRCGIRKKPESITRYDSIKGEIDADKLWNEGDHSNAILRNAVNTLNIFIHMINRPYKYVYDAHGAVEWNNYKLKLISTLSNDGEPLPAWYGICLETYFRLGCAYIGDGHHEEGYSSIEKAIEMAEKFKTLNYGDLLKISDADVFKNIKYVYKKNLIELPDGTREFLYESDFFDAYPPVMYYGMTAEQGWEWFNSARDEPKFKELVERVKKYYY